MEHVNNSYIMKYMIKCIIYMYMLTSQPVSVIFFKFNLNTRSLEVKKNIE